MTQNIAQNIIGNVASSYQVNLAIEIPNINENYINLRVFTCRHWVICNAYFNIRHVVGKFFRLARYFSNRECSELIGTCRENSV